MRAPVDLVATSGRVPRRTAVCLACRTALFAGEGCDADPSHPVATLDQPRGRELLVEAAWGPPDVRLGEARLALHSEQAVALLAMFGFVAGLLALWLALPGLGALHVLGAALTMALFWGGGNLLLARRGTEFPVGGRALAERAEALDERLLTDGAVPLGLRGVAAGEPALESPASGVACLAFAIELHFVGYWGDRVMYRDAVTCGFDVLLGDGRIAHVPAGRIRLVGPMRQVIDLDNAGLEAYLARVDREHDPGRAFDPLRYNVVAEAILLLGDQVELLSRFEPEVNPRAAPTSYREPAPSLWVSRGLPVVRVDPRSQGTR